MIIDLPTGDATIVDVDTPGAGVGATGSIQEDLF
jgi:hypothetical protein